jgi:hypothetical protein
MNFRKPIDVFAKRNCLQLFRMLPMSEFKRATGVFGTVTIRNLPQYFIQGA